MIANPSVGGITIRQRFLARSAAAHVVGLLFGAICIALVIRIIGILLQPKPLWLLAIPASLAAVLLLTRRTLRPVGWEVPRRWGRFGPAPYAFLFGAALGTGILTALPSPGMLVLYSWGLVQPNWSMALLPFLVFAGCRSIPLFAVTFAGKRGLSALFPLQLMGETKLLTGLRMIELAMMTAVLPASIVLPA